MSAAGKSSAGSTAGHKTPRAATHHVLSRSAANQTRHRRAVRAGGDRGVNAAARHAVITTVIAR
jgi:hypothetical protein